VPRVPLPDAGATFIRETCTAIRETCTASSEDITPRSSLLRTHAPIPCGSPLLRFVASFEESVQVATIPCCHQDFPDVIPESLSCDAWASATTVCRLLLPVASSASSAFPNGKWVGLPFPSAKATSQRGTFRRLQPFLDVQASQFACHSGRSYHNTCRAVSDVYIRAKRASFPPHVPDMLAVRNRQLTAQGLSPR